MQKKLLSLAIAGALAVPGAAMADVTSAGSDITIYGKLHASWDYVDNDANSADDSDDNTAVFRNSRLGFKGSEDLGNGLKGIWQVETHVNTAGSQDNSTTNAYEHNLALRNTYVGLQGDRWGRFLFGKHDTPYKMATAKLDIFSDTIADYNNIIGAHITNANGTVTSNFNERENQLAMYQTPNFNGFQAAIARASIQSLDNTVSSQEDDEAWSIMAMYDQGPFFGSLSYETYSGGRLGGSSQTEDIDAWKLGLGYAFGNSKLGFVYEDIEHDDETTAHNFKSRDAFWASFSHKFGANEVKLAYGDADDSDRNVDDGADNWSIGIDHNFSKRTKVYAIYSNMDNDTNANYGLYSSDNNAFDTSVNGGFYASGGASGDKDVDAFSVGIVHSF